MEKYEMLECLVNHYSNGNKARFAAKIGVSPQTLSKWISRNTFDAETLFEKCEGVSSSWLLTGEGEMIIRNRQNGYNQNANSELIDLCRELIANYQQRDIVMNKLVNILK